MSFLILLRYKRFLKTLSWAMMASLILSVFQNPQAFSLSVFAFVLVPVVQYRSVWYLTLPASRKRIAAWLALETIIQSTTVLVAMAILATVYMFSVNIEELSDAASLGLVGLAFGFFGQNLFPIFRGSNGSATPVAKLFVRGEVGQRLLFTVVPWFLILTLSFTGQLWVMICALIAIGLLLPLTIPTAFVFPYSLYESLKRSCLIFILIAELVFLTGLVYISHFAPVGGAVWAIRVAGNLPLFLSDTRTQEIVASPYARPLYALGDPKKLAEKLKLGEIGDRLKNCRTTGCLQLNETLGLLKNPDDVGRFLLLENMIWGCRVKVSENGRTQCSIPMPEKRLNEWMTDLRSSPGWLDSWLASDNVAKNYAAIRALWYFNFEPKHFLAVEKLRTSENREIAILANTFINYHKANEAFKNTCVKITKENMNYCREQERGIGALF